MKKAKDLRGKKLDQLRDGKQNEKGIGTHRLEGTGEVDEEATTKKIDRNWIHDDDDD